MKKTLSFDAQQQQVKAKLLHLLKNLEGGNSFFSQLFFKKKPAQSLYIYGSVGCGKTSLMQYFYDHVKKTPKTYFHFNSFMRLVHETLRDIRREEKKYKDELIEAIKRIIDDKKLLCFDEFQVLDIADAMLLSRIFSYLFAQGVIVIFTSNSHPRDLYKNGLQRELFLEFVDNILLKNCEIVKLDSGVDYRSIYRKNLHKRYFVSNQKNRDEIKEIIANLTKSQPLQPLILKIWGRDVVVEKTYEKIAVINYEEICKTNMGASD